MNRQALFSAKNLEKHFQGNEYTFRVGESVGWGRGGVGVAATLSNCFASFLKRSKIWQKYTKSILSY